MKKFISFILILLLNFLTIGPVFAQIDEYQDFDTPVFSASVEDEKVFLSPKTTYVLELESDLDLNETMKLNQLPRRAAILYQKLHTVQNQ